MNEVTATFDPEIVQWKPGAVSKDKTRAMALAYVDSRAYMERLDEVVPGWEDEYKLNVLTDRVIVLCHLTVAGVTRTGDGEALLVDNGGKPDPNAVTSASAQAFKRACAKFGLGRYLYDLPRVWVDYDPDKRYFTRDALAQLMAMLTDGAPPKSTQQQARASTDGNDSGSNQRQAECPPGGGEIWQIPGYDPGTNCQGRPRLPGMAGGELEVGDGAASGCSRAQPHQVGNCNNRMRGATCTVCSPLYHSIKGGNR